MNVIVWEYSMCIQEPLKLYMYMCNIRENNHCFRRKLEWVDILGMFLYAEGVETTSEKVYGSFGYVNRSF